jgi:hypothetical protein
LLPIFGNIIQGKAKETDCDTDKNDGDSGFLKGKPGKYKNHFKYGFKGIYNYSINYF